MTQQSSDKGITLIFGAIFLFALVRAALIVNMGAGLLLFLPTVGLPVYYFGRMFFLSLGEQGNQRPPTSEEANRQTKRRDRESQIVLWVFFGSPVVLLFGAWLHNEGDTHRKHQPTPTPGVVSYASAVQTSHPAPTPTPYWRPGVSLSMWYEDLLLERRDLDVGDPAAVQRFNAHVHEYDKALADARRVPGSP